MLFGRTLVFSLLIAGLSAAVCVCIGFPFTYFITRMKRRAQVIWLVLLMLVLSLSEVIVGFAWSVLLSRTAGLSNILVWLGLRAMLMARTRFERLVAFGLTATIGLQAIMNIAVVTVVTPTTGISLPFISAGGSSLLTFCLTTGILAAIATRGTSSQETE